jgi:hypothetical protein
MRLKPYQQQLKLACTVPGIKPTSAASILAETGMDMSPEGPFPDCHHLASWATVCPGNNESAGKRKSGETRQGNRWLRATLTQTRMGWSRRQEIPFPDAIPTREAPPRRSACGHGDSARSVDRHLLGSAQRHPIPNKSRE